MVFLNNILITSPDIVFNIPLDFTYDKFYHLHPKATSFCFTFVLVIVVNPIILVLVIKITWCKLLVVNALLKLLGSSQVGITLRFGYVFHITQYARYVGLILTISLKYSFCWISFPMSLICKNLNANSNLALKFKFPKLDIFLKIKLDSENFLKQKFVEITLSNNKVSSSFQNFSACKNSSFCKV